MHLIRLTKVLAVSAALALALSGCAGGKYVASNASNKYHDPDCVWAENIDWDRRIWFDSAEEAEKAGYVPCGKCVTSE